MADFVKLVAAKNVVIVDTRNPDEFKAGHIAGALLLPLEGRLTWPEEYETIVKQLIATKKPVVAYCA
jgi:rhodanese-related sulfurtransferase